MERVQRAEYGGYDRYLPNIRISLLKNSSNEYASYFNCINKLHTDEPYCAFISHDTIVPKDWDRQSILLFENTDSQSRKLLLTAYPQNDFTVCAGSFHVTFFKGDGIDEPGHGVSIIVMRFKLQKQVIAAVKNVPPLSKI